MSVRLCVSDSAAASSNGKYVTDLRCDDGAEGSQNIIDEDSNESASSKVQNFMSTLPAGFTNAGGT